MKLKTSPNGEKCFVPGCLERTCHGPDFGSVYCVAHEELSIAEQNAAIEKINEDHCANVADEDMSFLD